MQKSRNWSSSLLNTRYRIWAKKAKPPITRLEYIDELEGIDENGCVAVPEGPGLGVDFDWDWIKSHTVDTTVYK